MERFEALVQWSGDLTPCNSFFQKLIKIFFDLRDQIAFEIISEKINLLIWLNPLIFFQHGMKFLDLSDEQDIISDLWEILEIFELQDLVLFNAHNPADRVLDIAERVSELSGDMAMVEELYCMAEALHIDKTLLDVSAVGL